MSRLYYCLTTQHDLRLVAVAALICLLASWTTLSLARRGLQQRSFAISPWLVAAGIVAGCGVWATHFLAMLAYHPSMPVGYDLDRTIVSIGVAVSGGVAALAIAAAPVPGRLWWSGLCVGIVVGAMHYTGMAAVQAPAQVVWDQRLVAVSLLLGAGLGALAMATALGGQRARRRYIGTLLLTAAICAVHFIGMGAFMLRPDPAVAGPIAALSSWWLALAVAGIAALILIAALVGMSVDAHLARRTAREAQRLRTLVNATFEGLLIHADGVIVDANESLLTLLGYGADFLIGQPIARLASAERRSWVDAIETNATMEAVVTEFLRSDGQVVPVELLGRAIEYQSKPARVVAVRDITERRSSEERIHHLAYHDVVTDLPNRRLFREHLQLALARVQRGHSLAVLYLDLDRFKIINDTFGHAVGDALLRASAARLKLAVRSSDVIARFGGDEFAIVQEFAFQPEQATALCSRLVAQLSQPFEVDGHCLSIGVSIGVALADEPGSDPDGLLKAADLALYRAKSEGRGTWRFYEAEMDQRMQARHLLEQDLRQALALDQFEVVYQPLLNLPSEQISGFEALLRWQHPMRGTVSPADFIPLSEEIGLIVSIGHWVMRQACAEAAAWPGDLHVAVNLSPVQFRNANLADDVEQVLRDTGLPAARLELEVTESLLLGDEPSVLATLHALRDLGVRVAMDDFGTGYSSLSYLRRFPFDKIKIDQSFVRGMNESGDCSAIVRAIAGLGRSLGMTVNAEGVETLNELHALRAEHCDEVQGYLFSKPVPRANIPELLQRYGCLGELVLAKAS